MLPLQFNLNPKRNNAVDTWKGVAIFAVVGIHASNDAITFSFNDPNHWVGLFFRAILNFAVPLFFAISGYFSPRWEKIKKQGILAYYQRRLLPIWIPYVLWTVIYVLLRDWTHMLDPILLGKDLLLGSGIGIGYFVIVLTSLTLIHPLFAHWGSKISLFASSLLSLLSVGLLYWIRIEFGNQSIGKFPITALPFTTWMIFFYLGFYIQSRVIIETPKNKIIKFLIIAFTLNLIESFLIMSSFGVRSIAAGQVKLSTFFYSTCICFYALNHGLGRLSGQKHLVWLGQHSFIIYLSHMLFLTKINDALEKWLYNNQFINILASTTLTLLVCAFFIHAIKCILPNYLSEYLIGIKTMKSVDTGKSAIATIQQ